MSRIELTIEGKKFIIVNKDSTYGIPFNDSSMVDELVGPYSNIYRSSTSGEYVEIHEQIFPISNTVKEVYLIVYITYSKMNNAQRTEKDYIYNLKRKESTSIFIKLM